MSSSASHDAMNVTDIVPTEMLFVPSEAGISYSPDEYTASGELATGVNILEGTLRRLATE